MAISMWIMDWIHGISIYLDLDSASLRQNLLATETSEKNFKIPKFQKDTCSKNQIIQPNQV